MYELVTVSVIISTGDSGGASIGGSALTAPGADCTTGLVMFWTKSMLK